ncbi:MAG: ABC transporter substrate-binding protein [Verrucomicrobia bacterium]|nr:ABC transporter substrate-binding protein [Verrucomicrobiota bacterium]MBI3867250.1 ABC transporter substrate-binding protein [Verrucomicrobiota bacterium]
MTATHCAKLLLAGLCCTAATQGTVAEEARSLRLGHFPNITHAQALYAKAGGHFEKKLGIPVKWSSFNAGPTAIEALFTDAIDASFIGPGPAINGFIRSRGEKFVIIAGVASGGAGLVLRKGTGIKDEKDFGEATIATPQLGNTQDIAARIWFTERGYRFREKGGTLTLLALSNPDQLTLFKKGEIQGAWTVEPWLARLEIECGGELFLDEKSLWPDGRYATTVLIISREFLASNLELTRNLLRALVEVTQQINESKIEAAKILNAQLKKETGKFLADAVIAKALDRVEFTWDPVASSLRKSAESAHRIGFLRKAPDLKGVFQLEALNEVLKEKNLPAVAE